MNDETKKEYYYQEQWAKIQVEKHNAPKTTWVHNIIIILYLWFIVGGLLSVVVVYGTQLVILIVNWILLYLR